VVALVLIGFVAASPLPAQEKRVALVIGNSEYKHTTRLENPKNDAADVAATLGRLGFGVISGQDLDKAGMDRTIRDFAEALSGSQIGLFFYAGHGLQVDGKNYLVPIDAKLTTAHAMDFEMVRLDLVHRIMEREATTNILIMDACRDNPLARNLARALGTRSSQIGRGLAAVESGEGSLISFSTQPGNVALDGTGRNSPFAAALLKHISSPGDDLSAILINVRNDVMKETARRQVPWEHSALTAKFFFIPPRPAAQQIEFQFWNSVKDSTNPSVLGTYLERYPTGEYATIARALIQQHERQLKLELAALERERARQEEERKAAEAKRLEDEQRAREAALAAQRKQAEAAQNSVDTARLDKEMLTHKEELRKALEEARVAREAAKDAEQKRMAAVKAAEDAKKQAEQAIATKRDADTKDELKVAALPKTESKRGVGEFDGVWSVISKSGAGCRGAPGWTTDFFVANGKIDGAFSSGRISADGKANWRVRNARTGKIFSYSGTFIGSGGGGTFSLPGTPCGGEFTARRC
jgi:Caspase domain